jgi:hypothetical protein
VVLAIAHAAESLVVEPFTTCTNSIGMVGGFVVQLSEDSPGHWLVGGGQSSGIYRQIVGGAGSTQN